ncbi:MAG: ISL3 family transposase [Bacteroidota bacterium]
MPLDTVTCEHLLNIPFLRVSRVEIGVKEIHIDCYIAKTSGETCPNCGGLVNNKRPKYERTVRALDISGRKVYLHLTLHQYTCDCGRTFSEGFDFVSAGKSYTKRQSAYILEMCRKQSHLEVAAIVDMCHKTVERLCYAEIENRLTKVDWSKVHRIGIDEFSFRKGHKDFIVILADLDSHEVLDILEHRSKSFVTSYFKGLGEAFCHQIKEFCSDMWGPFQDIGKTLFPNALVHVERFHWMAHLNKALDYYRKYLRRTDKEESSFKNLKWKLIKRTENLKVQEVKDLGEAFEKNSTLKGLYGFSNELQAIFDKCYSRNQAEIKVADWLKRANSFDNKYLNKFIELFHRHQDNIMNYFYTRLSSAVVEGKNNLLRTIKRFTFTYDQLQPF